MEQRFLTAALYRFVDLPDFRQLREPLFAQCELHQVKGTILLAPEGINGTIAGSAVAIAALLAWLRSDPRFAAIDVKQSWADTAPFLRLKVRLKAEIVSMHVAGVNPLAMAGTYVEPQDWNQLVDDPDVVLVDARNDYEVDIGSFAGARNPRTKAFSELPAWLARQSLPGGLLAERAGRKPKVAMFCTGGIRCEKSTAYLRMQGFDEVFHLRGGILKYLETVPEAQSRWHGECFVFDERVSVGHGLTPGPLELCRSCRRPVGAKEKLSAQYQPGVSCPSCFNTTTALRKQGFAERQRQVLHARERGENHVGARMAPPRQRAAPPMLHAPVNRLLELLGREPGRRVLVGLAGLPGSGKSTLALRLEQEVNAAQGTQAMQALGMDGFHLTRSQLAAFPDPALGLARRGAPWTFDAAGFCAKLRALRLPAGDACPDAVLWPDFEHGVGDPVADAVAVATQVRLVLVEGLYLLHQADGWNLAGLFDEVWFLDAEPGLCEQRLVARHCRSWGLTEQQALARVAGNDRLNAALVLGHRSRADFLVQP